MFRTDVLSGIVYWVMTGIQYVIPLISVWLWKLILDELSVIFQTKTSSHIVWFYLGLYLALQVFLSIIKQINSVIYDKIKRKVTCNLDMTIMEKMANIDAAFFDNPQNSNMLISARTSEIYITDNITWMIDTVIRTIVFISGLVVFLSYDWIVGILFIATYIPGSIISFRDRKRLDDWSINNIPESRKKDYYKSLLTGHFAALDLRLYNLSDYFKKQYNELWNKIRVEREKLFVKGFVASFFSSFLTYSGIVAIILLSVHSVLRGKMPIGTLALYIGLAQTSGRNFGSIVRDIVCQVKIIVPYIILYSDFLNYDNNIKDEGEELIPQYPEIEFHHVYFKYPGNEEYTLKNLSFKIGSGKKIALIGVNGAGKTTIIKLLLRFYDPNAGEILLNGKNIRNYPLCEIHKMFGVCFQDINCYSMTFRENIAMSDIDRKDEDKSIMAAAEASGANEFVASLVDGLETDMTKRFNNEGVALSRGQWQKIALARAFFRDSQFVILDEPSSALDPEAEDYIFSSFKCLCKDKGGILVSHRLSSIMMVDEILVLDCGVAIESGTHTELMRRNGKYASMYRMQSEKYRRHDKNE